MCACADPGGLVGIGVVVLDEPVPVGGDAARVPALPRPGLEALTGLHHQLVVVAAGDPDVDVSEHDRAEGFLQRLVGAAEPHACRPKVVLHAEGDRGIARQPRDRLNDHAIEGTWPERGRDQQLVQPAISCNGDGEARERAPRGESAGTGLDVVVVGDDPPPSLGHARLRVGKLPREGEGRILLVLGGARPYQAYRGVGPAVGVVIAVIPPGPGLPRPWPEPQAGP